jgi:hypothetical protein
MNFQLMSNLKIRIKQLKYWIRHILVDPEINHPVDSIIFQHPVAQILMSFN